MYVVPVYKLPPEEFTSECSIFSYVYNSKTDQKSEQKYKGLLPVCTLFGFYGPTIPFII